MEEKGCFKTQGLVSGRKSFMFLLTGVVCGWKLFFVEGTRSGWHLEVVYERKSLFVNARGHLWTTSFFFIVQGQCVKKSFSSH